MQIKMRELDKNYFESEEKENFIQEVKGDLIETINNKKSKCIEERVLRTELMMNVAFILDNYDDLRPILTKYAEECKKQKLKKDLTR